MEATFSFSIYYNFATYFKLLISDKNLCIEDFWLSLFLQKAQKQKKTIYIVSFIHDEVILWCKDYFWSQ